jgi:alpha,alpha-trehalose phosphorylase
MQTARLDIDNTHGNTHHGVHTAAMAGTWLGVAYGFAGMRVKNGMAHFAPVLPKQWQHYRFHVHLQGALLQVQVNADTVDYQLLRGDKLSFQHRAQLLELDQNKASCTLALSEGA